MAFLAKDAIQLAVETFEDLDPAKARRVFKIDKEMFELQLDLEQRCLDLIALQTPVARDLRRVGTTFKVVTDLDRIGRYARDIAEITLKFPDGHHLKRLVSIPHMADLTVAMVEKAVRALIHEDVQLAEDLDDDDEAVDALYDEIFRESVTYMMDGTVKITTGAHYILVARYLERIADHSVNIGERVIYLVTAKRPQWATPAGATSSSWPPAIAPRPGEEEEE
jgi:phosphate transport system protein